MAKNEVPAAPAKAAVFYTRAQVMRSRRYAPLRDLVSVLLEEGRQYTLDEVDRKIEIFRKGKVS